MTARKRYSKEFKFEAVNLVLGQGYSRIEAAKSLNINQALLSRWIKELLVLDVHAFKGNGKLSLEQVEIRRLKDENKRLKIEREILKKCGALVSAGNKVKYLFIAQNSNIWPVDVMCKLLGLTRQGYYSYKKRTTK